MGERRDTTAKVGRAQHEWLDDEHSWHLKECSPWPSTCLSIPIIPSQCHVAKQPLYKWLSSLILISAKPGPLSFPSHGTAVINEALL